MADSRRNFTSKAGTRPLSALGPAINSMGETAAKSNLKAVQEATQRLALIVDMSGRRYHIRGRGGTDVPLSASRDVREFERVDGRGVFTGRVQGVPQGFWAIVEHGSDPHPIYRRAAGRDGKRGRKMAQKSFLKKVTEGHVFNDIPVMSNGRGQGFVAPYVLHPGHKSLGTPWRKAMDTGAPEVARIIRTRVGDAFGRSFKGSN